MSRQYPHSAEETRLHEIVGARIRRLMAERGINETSLVKMTGLSQGAINKAKLGDRVSPYTLWRIQTELDASDGEFYPVTATNQDLDRELRQAPREAPPVAVQPLADGPKSAVFLTPRPVTVEDDIVKPGQTWTWHRPNGTFVKMFVQWLQKGPGHAVTVRGVVPHTTNRIQIRLSVLRKGQHGAQMLEEIHGFVFERSRTG